MDFAALPPEINSGLMYSGPGSGPMLAAATAWGGLAAELDSVATSYGTLVGQLTGEEWLGPASASMVYTVMPYVDWLHATAGLAAEAATQVRTAAAAYETAFAATVPPMVVAANRAMLVQLVATNILGQNAPAIAANQADYAEMGAQDGSAMSAYSAASAAATQLTPFPPPEQTANPDGPADQAAAVAQSAGNTTADSTQNALSAVPQTLQQLALPLQAAPVQAVVDDVGVEATAASGLSLGSAYHAAIGSTNFFQRLVSQFGFNQPQSTNIKDTVDRIALATGAVTPDELAEATAGSPLGGLGSWQKWLNMIKGLHLPAFHTSATAGAGQASMVGELSVPPTWTSAAPAMNLVSAESSSSAGVAAAPAAADGGTGSMGAQAALAAMAGRAFAGTVVPGRDGARSTGREREKPSADAAKEIAAALREYASLRDSGIITDTEFNKHKERLMSLDPLSGR